MKKFVVLMTGVMSCFQPSTFASEGKEPNAYEEEMLKEDEGSDVEVAEETEEDKAIEKEALLKLLESQRSSKYGARKKELQDLQAMVKESRKVANMVMQEPTYFKDPYDAKKGSITITNRKISIEGAITQTTALKLIKKIEYFNNVSEKAPIFILIDSPGGSVMAGFQIIQSIQSSPAPVHVIVTNFAASMAAVIAASANYSYALPNAVILFHEVSSGMMGNTTEFRETCEWLRKLEDRLITPLLPKLGYASLEDWRDDLRRHSSSGDWKELADEAQKLGWVQNLVNYIRDTSVTEDEFEDKKPMGLLSLLGGETDVPKKEATEEDPSSNTSLPKLSRAGDCYFLSDPTHCYVVK